MQSHCVNNSDNGPLLCEGGGQISRLPQFSRQLKLTAPSIAIRHEVTQHCDRHVPVGPARLRGK